MWALGCIFAELILGHKFDDVLGAQDPQFQKDVCSRVVSNCSNIGSVVKQLLETKASERLSAEEVLARPEVVSKVWQLMFCEAVFCALQLSIATH
jgi:hypothetical protein